jgi:PAS domain S-box-containing protein
MNPITSRALSLRLAVLLAVLFGLLVPALLVGGYSWFKRSNQDLRTQTRQLAEQHAEVLVVGIQEPLSNNNRESAKALINAFVDNHEDIVRIDLRDTVNKIIVSAEKPERRRDFTDSSDKRVTYRANTLGSIQVEVSSSRLRKILDAGLNDQIAALLSQTVLAIVLLLAILHFRLIRPLAELGKGVQRLVAHQLDAPFTWKRLDEIGLLAQKMEAMRTSLRRMFYTLEMDIDMRMHVEQELQQGEQRYRLLVEKSPIAIIEWDAGLRVVEWNAAAERIFGWPRAQALGQHAAFLVPEANRKTASETMQKLASGAGVIFKTFENLTVDDEIIYCQWRITRIDDQANGPGHMLSMAEDVTERRRIEQEHRLSQAKFISAFQGNPDYISISRVDDGTMLDVNQAYSKFIGYSREEIIGKTSIELNLWPYQEEREELISELRRTGVARNAFVSLRTKTGEIRACRINSNLFMLGTVQHMMAVGCDVTDQSHLQEQKAEVDRALLRLAQGIQGMAGEAFFELLVADLASALRTDRAFIGLLDPDAPGRIRTLVAHSNGSKAENFEYPIHRAPCECVMTGEICVFSGGLREGFPHDHALVEGGWDSYAGAPIHDAAGHTIGVLAVMHTQPLGNPDLVKSLLQVFSERASAELERKRAEEAQRTSELRFSTMFQASPVAMFVTEVDRDHMIKDVNSAFERLFLRHRDEVVGRSTIDLALYCNLADRGVLVEELARSESTDSHEFWMRRGDGEKVLVHFSGHTFSLGGHKFAILACQDVTDKRRIEDEIRELNATLEERVIERTEELQQANQELGYTLDTLNLAQEELVRSEKLAALGSLVAGIAHELNTPIGNSLMVASTLVDQTRILRKSYTSDKGVKRSVLESYFGDASKAGDIIVRNLYRAANLVTSFKQVAMDQTSSQRRTFSLAEVISEIMLTLWPTLKKTTYTVKKVIPEDILLDSYPGPLGQVVTNLLNNAILHAFDGRDSGTITIEATRSVEGWIDLVVTDDGVGITPSNLNRIFDPFFTTKLGAGGSGLGLNITHNIVTGILGGRIRVYSQLDGGTTFTVTLPLVAPQKQIDDIPIPIKSPVM